MLQTENSSLNKWGGIAYRKTSHAQSKDDPQGWEQTEVCDTLNIFDYTELRTPILILENHPADSRVTISQGGGSADIIEPNGYGRR
jgi:hypothetical protein